MPLVKKIFCLMLAVWIGLVAGFAQAHSTAEDLHQLEHVVLDASASGSHDAGHDEHCGMAQCGHVFGVALTSASAATTAESTRLVSPQRRHATSFVANDIDRPKWAAPTSAVASL